MIVWFAHVKVGHCQAPYTKSPVYYLGFFYFYIILYYLKSHPDANGKELRNALAPHVAQSCFYNTLNRLDITYKKRNKI